MVNLRILLLSLLAAGTLSAQPGTLQLSEARELATARLPVLQGATTLAEMNRLQEESIRSDRLPTVALQAEGSLQSETVAFPEDLPLPVEIDLPLYGARAYADIRWAAYDGGLANARKQVNQAHTAVARQELIVQADRIREQVDGLFLNIHLLEKQRDILTLSLEDLAGRKEALQARVDNGVLLPAELSRLEVRELELIARQQEMLATSESLYELLSYLCGQEISPDTRLLLPDLAEPAETPALANPELTLFALQRKQIAAQSTLIDARRQPKLALFAKGGIGYPNPLNFFDNSLSPYALGGLSFSWQVFDWGKADRDRQQLQLQQELVRHQEEQFRWMQNAGTEQYRTEVKRLHEQLDRDLRIVELQNAILEQLNAQLDNGVITATDYLTQLNARQQAELNYELHQIQLIRLHVDFYRTRGADWE